MKAAICTSYGSPEVLQIQEILKPIPKDSEILVKIMASAVNSGDVRVRSLNVKGILKVIMRLVLGISKPRKPVLGTVFSGVVESIGSKVSKFKVGNKVFGMTGFSFGTHTEYIAINQNNNILEMPQNASFEDAASIVFGGQTALYYLSKSKIAYKKNAKVLILGATGSVGSAAVQIAKYYNAHVTAVCSADGEKMVSELGVTDVILYDKQDFSQHSGRFDIIFDAVGKYSKKQCRHLLNSSGVYVSVSIGYASENIKQLQQLKEMFEKLQIWSGLYLAVFFVIHVGAVMVGRVVLQLDTNFYFGAAGINAFPFNLFFIPYYTLAILSFFAHIASIHAQKMKIRILRITPSIQSFIIICIGTVVMMIVFYGLTNKFSGVSIPKEYQILIGK